MAKQVLEDSAAIERFFSANAHAYERFINAFRYGAGLREFLRSCGYVRPGAKVLDAGCGTGALTRAMHQIAMRRSTSAITFHAFDLTPAMTALLQEWRQPRETNDIAIQHANVLQLETLPATWRDYDLIVSSAMLEYLPKHELVRALRSLGRLLGPDGVLLVFISRESILMHGLIRVWWRANLYDARELERSFTDAGLRFCFHRFRFPYAYLNLWGRVVEARWPDPSELPPTTRKEATRA